MIDRQSPTWTTLAQWLKLAREDYRSRLTVHKLPEVEAEFVRGKLAMIDTVLELPRMLEDQRNRGV